MTIRHVVAWKLAADDARIRAEQAAEISRLLHTLPPLVPEIRALEVGINALELEGNFDVVLIADFDDADALARYGAHPEHLKVAGYIHSVVADRTAVDYRVAALLAS